MENGVNVGSLGELCAVVEKWVKEGKKDDRRDARY